MKVKNVKLLPKSKKEELFKLINALPKSIKVIFAEVSSNLTTCLAYDLGYGIRVRISVYGGDFSSYYISYFEGDDVIFQDHLDFDNTILSINSVIKELNKHESF